jgi:hypothetical protein
VSAVIGFPFSSFTCPLSSLAFHLDNKQNDQLIRSIF